MTKEHNFPYQVFSTPKEYFDQYKARWGSGYGMLGVNSLNTGPRGKYATGQISSEEFKKALQFEDQLMQLLIPEMTEEQRIQFGFNNFRILSPKHKDHTPGEYLREFLKFESLYKDGKISLTDDDLIEVHREVTQKNFFEAAIRRREVEN